MQHHHSPRILLLATAVVLTSAAVTHAGPITTLFNTGVDANGTPRANLASETHYTLVGVPAGGVTGLRVATSANGFPIGPWVGDNASSAWIGPDSGGANDLGGPAGQYDYRTTFDLSGFNPKTVSIAGLWSVDNAGIDILINGVSTGNTIGDPASGDVQGFRSFYAFNVTNGFLSGVNTLDFIVLNQSGPTGLRVQAAGMAEVPEPISLAVLGSGLLALGMIRRRHA